MNTTSLETRRVAITKSKLSPETQGDISMTNGSIGFAVIGAKWWREMMESQKEKYHNSNMVLYQPVPLYIYEVVL